MGKKILIIGAGPAGLTAAYELLNSGKDYEVTVLERSERIGGISQTVRYNGNRMDIGGHRFFSKDDEVMNWWAKMMPIQGAPSIDDRLLSREVNLSSGGPDPEKDDRVMLVRHRVSRIYYKKKFFDYPISMKWETIKNMGFGTTMKAGFSYLRTIFVKLPETSLENFYINRFGRVLYSMFFEGYTEKLWGRHPRDISADWGSQRVKGLSIMAIIRDMFGKIFGGKNRKVETSLIEEFWYPKYGPGHLWEYVKAQVEQLGGTVRMNCEVNSLHTLPDGTIDKAVCTLDGKKTEIECDTVISSMPVKDLVAGLADISDDIKQAAADLPYRDFVTVGLLVNKLELENKTQMKTLGNIVPDCWIYVQDTGVKLGRIQIFNNWSPYMVADPEHTVWIGLEYFCTEGDDFWSMSDEECIRFATKELVSMGVIASEDSVLDSHRERIQKAYPAYFDSYSRMSEIIESLDKHPNLFCVGRNGQHRYNNMDHSMATSFEAVRDINAGVSDRSNVWSVNTEKEYHESKKSE